MSSCATTSFPRVPFPFLSSSLYHLQIIGISPNRNKLQKEIIELETRILDVMKKKYQPWQVFIIYNTETSQRECLNKLAIGLLFSPRVTIYRLPQEVLQRHLKVTTKTPAQV